MPVAVGLRFSRYELLDRLGAGGMGEVFRARDHDLGRDVAVKFLPERFASDPDRLARFANEARAASALDHPNLVTIHEIGQFEGLPYMVMEHVKGETFRKLLEGHPLAPRRVLDLGIQVADGLAKAHDAGIVHRDLKPENLMLSADGFVKILDFGLAKLRAPEEAPTEVRPDASTDAGAAPVTGVGGLVGTAGYMSPEQAAGRTVDFRSDQFALGTVLYEMATGRNPFRRATAVQTLSAILESEPEPLSTLCPALPAPVRWILERCLAKVPADRYASTADLARELRDVRDHLSQASDAAATGGPAASAASGRRFGRVLAALLVGLGALFALPSVREHLLAPLQLLPLPAEKRIAVLPFRATGGSAEDAQLCDGLVEYLVARLGQLERFQSSAWVVPTVEVRQAGVSGAAAARRTLGATLVVTGSLQRVGERAVLTLNVIDAVAGRQLRAATVEYVPGVTPLLDRAVEAVTGMLDLELGPDARVALRAGGTGVVEASTLYAQALGYAPYSQARTALQRYEQEQSLEHAIELFNRALERDPAYALAHAGLGEAYWRLSRLTRNDAHVKLAEEQCQRALALDGTLAPVWVTMGLVHLGSGRAEVAVEDLRRALERDPRSADAHRELANALERLGRKDQAEATYREAIELRPDSWINHHQFASYLLAHGRAAEAQVRLEEALQLVPDNPRAWSNLGAAYYFQGRQAEAEKAWQRSLELYPTSSAASNLGTRQFFAGRYGEAARTFESATRIDARDYRVWRNLGAAYYWAPGERERSSDAYRRAVELGERERALDPGSAWVLADLADSYAMLGELAKARQLLAAAESAGREQGPIARSIAETYERLDDRNAALAWVAVALRLDFPREEIEAAPGLRQLRADPRYRSLAAGGKG